MSLAELTVAYAFLILCPLLILLEKNDGLSRLTYGTIFNEF